MVKKLQSACCFSLGAFSIARLNSMLGDSATFSNFSPAVWFILLATVFFFYLAVKDINFK